MTIYRRSSEKHF